jgi:hypothetical protein
MGPKGATGATGVQLASGVNYSDYLFWNPAANAWQVGDEDVHLGAGAGSAAQGIYSVAIGNLAGKTQGDYAVAIGNRAGEETGDGTVAIGNGAGSSAQDDEAVAIGRTAGNSQQGAGAVSVGGGAGRDTQGPNAVALGTYAGAVRQGEYAIAIGYYAGENDQAPNSIIINANDVALQPQTAGLFVNPVRLELNQPPLVTGPGGFGPMFYDDATKEITWGEKTFIINHPTAPDRYLVHACLEGPEAGVYYRGESELVDGQTQITLPDYVPDLADNFTVQLTQIWRGQDDSFARLSATRVDDQGTFTVHGDPCAFAWHVHGTRQYIDTEPLKAEVNVVGDGPYRYIQ